MRPGVASAPRIRGPGRNIYRMGLNKADRFRQPRLVLGGAAEHDGVVVDQRCKASNREGVDGVLLLTAPMRVATAAVAGNQVHNPPAHGSAGKPGAWAVS
jgi:hypothetical protein